MQKCIVHLKERKKYNKNNNNKGNIEEFITCFACIGIILYKTKQVFLLLK